MLYWAITRSVVLELAEAFWQFKLKSWFPAADTLTTRVPLVPTDPAHEPLAAQPLASLEFQESTVDAPEWTVVGVPFTVTVTAPLTRCDTFIDCPDIVKSNATLLFVPAMVGNGRSAPAQRFIVI
jgi:hypothetical protein